MLTPTRNPSEVRVEVAPSASEDAAEDVSESCTICMSRPRAVRFLPCRHAVMCEVCAMTEMKRTGKCSHCRRPVEGLVFVPVTPLGPKRLKTHQDEPEPEGLYQSKQEFLQQAGAAGRRSQTGAAGRRSQTGAAGRPAPSLRRVCSGKSWVVHGLLLEYSDGVRTGFFVENDGSPLWLFDNAALLRRGGVWQVAGLCGVGR